MTLGKWPSVRHVAAREMTTFGRYTLVRKLATGGMAEVFLARADGPRGFQKKCVLKRILPHFTDDPAFVDMFLAEARLAADLNHPNLVQIFDFGEVDGQYFIAMEYIDGPNLRSLNREVRHHDGPMRLTLAARIITLAAEGLHCAHELKDEQGHPVELVHRDISPDNVLVSRGGGVKVVDFGIAKAANQPHLTKSGMIKGKLAYMPPEQLAREPLDRRADIFALGVVLYELVSGEMPFDASSEVSIIQAIMGHEPLRRVHTRRDDVPPELDSIVARCLEKDREGRYATCRELQGDLERFIQASGEVVGASDIGALVERSFPPEAEAAGQPMPSGAVTGAPLDVTVPRAKSANRPTPDVATVPSGHRAVSKAPAREKTPAPQPSAVYEAQTEREAPPSLSPTAVRATPPPNRTPQIVVGVVLMLVFAGALTYSALKSSVGTPAVIVVDAGATLPLPTKVVPMPVPDPVAIDAGEASAPAPELDAGAAAAAPPALDAAVEQPLDSGAGTAALVERDAGTAASPLAHPTATRTGTLELRIRPYAEVSIDGHPIGDTPLPVQVLPLGHHKVRLVNPTLEKDVQLDVVIKPGENVLKHNFKE